jgi:hypothetical protein
MEHREEQFIGHITAGIDHGTLALSTINFVRQQLPAWRDDPSRKEEQSENRLNLQLCKFLDSRARNDFPMIRFDHEEYQTGHRSVDLSAYPAKLVIIGARQHTLYDPILVLECKRLPAPSSDHQREYITGGIEQQSGGIQRFKMGLHGADLDIAAMIGYVQERSTGEWHRKINGWISELCSGKMTDGCLWQCSEILELLGEDVPTGIASYRSVHVRNGRNSSKEIQIQHVWIAMNKRQAQN